MGKNWLRKFLLLNWADRIATMIIVAGVCVFGLTALHYGRRVLVCDRFVIRGMSMNPTFEQGQRVWVKKFWMGPRIYTRFDFNEGEPLRCVRLPGLRRLKAGDIAVFNSPEGWGRFDTVTFQLNNVYAKRCLGAAGDTVGARNCHYYSSGVNPTGIPLNLESILRASPDSELVRHGGFEAGYFAREHERWTIKDFGPIVVPAKGMAVQMDSTNVLHFAKVICYETGERPEWRDGRAWLEGEQITEYSFKKDWCFFVGDNILNSRDSRYLGFVPEEFVVGIVCRRKR